MLATKEDSSSGNSDSIFHISKKLVAIGKTKDALELMIEHAMKSKDKYHDEFLKISATYYQYLESKNLNLASERELSVAYANVNYNLLKLITKMENKEPTLLFSGSLPEKIFKLVLQVYGYLRLSIILFLLLICVILFYFRRDIITEVFYYGDVSGIYHLFYPIFLLLVVLVIIFYKPKKLF